MRADPPSNGLDRKQNRIEFSYSVVHCDSSPSDSRIHLLFIPLDIRAHGGNHSEFPWVNLSRVSVFFRSISSCQLQELRETTVLKWKQES